MASLGILFDKDFLNVDTTILGSFGVIKINIKNEKKRNLKKYVRKLQSDISNPESGNE